MNHEREVHLHTIQEQFCQEVSDKYRKGQNEHGGNLWEKDNLAALGEEAIDFVVYFYTIRANIQHIKDVVYLLDRQLAIDKPDMAIVRAYSKRLKKLTFIQPDYDPTTKTSP